MPSFAALLPLRVLTCSAPPSSRRRRRAAIGVLVPPEQRGRAITFIFLGWSVASVLGMPMRSFIGETLRLALAPSAASPCCSLVAAAWVWRAMPDGVKPPALSLAAWSERLRDPRADGDGRRHRAARRRAVRAVLLLRALLPADARRRRRSSSLLFLWFGVFGADRQRADVALHRPHRRRASRRRRLVADGAVACCSGRSPAASSALAARCSCRGRSAASRRTRRSRRGCRPAAPALAPALLALNTSAIYLGQAIGRRERRLADRPPRLRAAALGGLGWLAWPARSRSASGRACSSAAACALTRRRRDGRHAATAAARAAGIAAASCSSAFTRLALQGFGGVLAVAQRELVERQRWLTREEFVEMLAVAQVLPGPNVVNLSLMIGDRYFGLRGALAALGGHAAVPLVIVLVLAAGLRAVRRATRRSRGALRGMGAVAAGLIARHRRSSCCGALRTQPARACRLRRRSRCADLRRRSRCCAGRWSGCCWAWAALAVRAGLARRLAMSRCCSIALLGAADWLGLFVHFLVLSLLAVGGAITTAPDMHRYVVDEHHWLSDAAVHRVDRASRRPRPGRTCCSSP